MPMRSTVATLSADQTTCTFPDGVTAVFNNPIPQLASHITDPTGIALDIHAPTGSICGHLYYVENAADVLAVRVGTEGVSFETPLDDGNFYLDCPAHTYTTSDDDPPTCGVPGFSYPTSGPPPYTFTLFSTGLQSPLFACQ
jgi:hypothetical protein